MLKDKRGEGYIQVCVLVIVLCMIMSVFVTFAGTVNVVKLTERNTKTVLEQSTNETEYIDANEFISDLADFCTFVKSGSYYYHRDANRRTEYYISKPTVGFTEDERLRLYVSYTLYVPIYFNNVRISTVKIPTTVKINFDQRF